MPKEWIAIGCLKRPVGLDGFCAIEPFGSTFGTLKPPCTVFIGPNAKAAESMVLEKIVHRPGGYQCRFEGKDDRTSIEGMRGKVIYIESEALPGLSGNEFYHFELTEMSVFEDVGGTCIGKVVEVHNFPSMDTIEVMPGNGESIMVPLSAQAIAGIDRQGKRITVHQRFIEELLQ
jgi:16S rRNA processing protein RimM